MTTARSTPSVHHRTVLRRNVPLRLAGAGYALVTGGWWAATVAQMPPQAVVGETLFGLLTLVGLFFALYRDDIAIDHAAGHLRTARGLPGFLKTSEASLREFDRLLVEEEATQDYPEDAIQPVRRAWFSVYLSDSHSGRKLLLLSKSADESSKARAAGLEIAEAQAKRLSAILNLPVEKL